MNNNDLRRVLTDLQLNPKVTTDESAAIRIALHLLGVAREALGPLGYDPEDATKLPDRLRLSIHNRSGRDTDDISNPADKARISTLTMMLANANALTETTKADRTRLQARVTELERQSRTDLAAMQGMELTIRNQAAELQTKAQDLERIRTEAELAKESFQQRVSVYAEDLKTAQRSYDLMQDMHNDQVALVVRKNQELDQVRADLENAEAIIGSATAGLNQRTAQLNTAEAALLDAQQRLDTATTQNEGLSRQANHSAKVVAELLEAVGKANTERDLAKADYTALLQVNNETLAELQSVRASTTASLSQLSQLSLSQTQRADQLASELAAAKAVATTATEHLSNLLIIAGQGLQVRNSGAAETARGWLSTNPLTNLNPSPITNQEQ